MHVPKGPQAAPAVWWHGKDTASRHLQGPGVSGCDRVAKTARFLLSVEDSSETRRRTCPACRTSFACIGSVRQRLRGGHRNGHASRRFLETGCMLAFAASPSASQACRSSVSASQPAHLAMYLGCGSMPEWTNSRSSASRAHRVERTWLFNQRRPHVHSVASVQSTNAREHAAIGILARRRLCGRRRPVSQGAQGGPPKLVIWRLHLSHIIRSVDHNIVRNSYSAL